MDAKQIRTNQALKVTGGEYQGIAGDVVEVVDGGAVIHCAGNFNGEPINENLLIEAENLEIL